MFKSHRHEWHRFLNRSSLLLFLGVLFIIALAFPVSSYANPLAPAASRASGRAPVAFPAAQATPTPDASSGTVPVILQPPDNANLLQGSLGIINGTTAKNTPGVVIQIYDADRLLGEVSANPQGKWSYSLPDLAPGAHTFTVWQGQGDGVLISTPVTIVVKAVSGSTLVGRPTLQLKDPDSAPDATTPIYVIGTGTANSTVRIVQGGDASGAGVVVLGVAQTDDLGNWSYILPPLSAGSYTLAAQVLDNAQKPVSVSTPLFLKITASASPAVAPSDNGATAEPSPNVTSTSGTAPATPVSATAQATTTATASPASQAAPTNAALTTEATATAAAAASTPTATTAPSEATAVPAPLTIGKPAGGELAPGAVMSGRGAPGAALTLSANGKPLGTATVDPNGTWSFTLPSDVATGIVEFQVDQTNPTASVSVSINVAPSSLPATGASDPLRRAYMWLLVTLGAGLAFAGFVAIRSSRFRRN